jgi:hypothetical protein
MIAITTKSSIKVNPQRRERMASPPSEILPNELFSRQKISPGLGKRFAMPISQAQGFSSGLGASGPSGR